MRVDLSLTTRNLAPLSENMEFMRVRFSSDNDFLMNEVLVEDFKKAIGLFGADAYKKSPYFYLQSDYETNDLKFSENIKRIIDANTEIYRVVFNHLMSFLWLQKDNCCSIGAIYTFLPEHKIVFEKTNGYNYSKWNGMIDEKTSFTNQEIKESFELYAKISAKFYHRNIRIGRSDEPRPDLITDRSVTPYDIKKETRLERAFNFLDVARKTRNIPEKIAFFVCIFETLFFGKDSGEIAHQVAERVALYASNTRIFRLGIYTLVKDAYRIRSTYFHGNSFANVKDDKLLSISERIDFLTRNVFNQIITSDADIFLQPTELLEMSFSDLLFEDERQPDGLTIDTDLKHKRFNS